MPNLTENYGLKKPLSEEFYDVNVQNENMDIIDEELKKRASIAVTSEIPEDTEFWIDPDDESVEESHVLDKNNPHGVTPAQIGAATAEEIANRQLNSRPFYFDGGTGSFKICFNQPRPGKRLPLRVTISTQLGDVTTLEFVVHGDTAAPVVGVCRVHGDGVVHKVVYSTENGVTTYSITTTVSAWAMAYVECQTHYFDGSYKGFMPQLDGWMAHLTDGTEMVLEYENPPMMLNMEYRTTERWSGVVVYTKMVNCGAFYPAGSMLYYGVGETATRILRVTGTAENSGLSVPYVGTDASVHISANVYEGKGMIGVYVDMGDLTADKCIAQVWYTKD